MPPYRSKGDNMIVAYNEVWDWLKAFLLLWWRTALNWIDTLITGRGPLERMLSRAEYSAPMAVDFFNFFREDQRTPEVGEALAFSDPIDVPRLRNRILEAHLSVKSPAFSIVPNVENCLRALSSVNATDRAVTDRARTPFDSDNAEHESGLAELWQLLRPNRTRSGRKTKEWQELGFQGADPATDFRGMGLLGLDQMLFMALEDTEGTRAVVDQAAGARGYPWAIVVIQLTSYTHSLLKARRVMVHFLSMGQEEGVRHFHQLTQRLMLAFHRLWLDEGPENVMEFPRVFGAFKTRMEQHVSEGKLSDDFD